MPCTSAVTEVAPNAANPCQQHQWLQQVCRFPIYRDQASASLEPQLLAWPLDKASAWWVWSGRNVCRAGACGAAKRLASHTERRV